MPGIASLPLWAVSMLLANAASFAANESSTFRLDPNTFRMLADTAYFAWVAAVVVSSAVVWATSAVALRTGVLPRWYARVGILAGVVQLFGFFFFPFFVWWLWIIVTSILLISRPSPAPARVAAAGAVTLRPATFRSLSRKEHAMFNARTGLILAGVTFATWETVDIFWITVPAAAAVFAALFAGCTRLVLAPRQHPRGSGADGSVRVRGRSRTDAEGDDGDEGRRLHARAHRDCIRRRYPRGPPPYEVDTTRRRVKAYARGRAHRSGDRRSNALELESTTSPAAVRGTRLTRRSQDVIRGAAYQVNVMIGDRASKRRVAEALAVGRSFRPARPG